MAGPILRLKDLMAHTGLSRSAIYDRMDKKSPRYSEDFPKSFPLGGGAIGWFKADIDIWLETCATNAKNGTPSKKPKPSADSKGFGGQAPSTPSELPESSKPVRKPSQQPTSAPKHPTSLSSAKRSVRPGNLAEAIVEGGRINDRLLNFLQMKTWTPAMAALLISGIEPPQGCREIPNGGIGLDEEPLHGSNARLNEARRILEEWCEWKAEHEDQPADIEPIRFFTWCMEEDIKTEWLHLFLELIGFTDENAVDLTTARFALLTGCQTINSAKIAGNAKSSDSITGETSKEKNATVQTQGHEKGYEPSATPVSIQPSVPRNNGTELRWTSEALKELRSFRSAHTVEETSKHFLIAGSRVRDLLADKGKKTKPNDQPNVWSGLHARR